MTRMLLALAAATLCACAAAPASAVADAQPELRLGSRGPMVADWQRILDVWLPQSTSIPTIVLRKELGPDVLVVDGVYGPHTEAATKRWQQESHLRPTGVVGLASWKAWVESNVTCCGAGLPSVGPGDVSAYVGWWQIALRRWLLRHGQLAIVVDGVYGPRTEAATAVFQGSAGLAPTGRADRPTWAAMSRLRPGTALP